MGIKTGDIALQGQIGLAIHSKSNNFSTAMNFVPLPVHLTCQNIARTIKISSILLVY